MDTGVVAVTAALAGGLVSVLTTALARRTPPRHRIEIDGQEIADVSAETVSAGELREAIRQVVTAAAAGEHHSSVTHERV